MPPDAASVIGDEPAVSLNTVWYLNCPVRCTWPRTYLMLAKEVFGDEKRYAHFVVPDESDLKMNTPV